MKILAALGALSLVSWALLGLHAWVRRNDPLPSDCPCCGRIMAHEEPSLDVQRELAPEVAL